MLTIDQFRADLRHEIDVIKHLGTKVPPHQYDWRPTPAQRSTLELMQYLTWCAIGPMRAAIEGGWDHMQGYRDAGCGVTPETFAACMDAQAAALDDLVASLGKDDLARPALLPWGQEVTLGRALIDMGLKTLVAYRMQLFLYAKQSGNADIGSPDCWIGRDGFAPKKS